MQIRRDGALFKELVPPGSRLAFSFEKAAAGNPIGKGLEIYI